MSALETAAARLIYRARQGLEDLKAADPSAKKKNAKDPATKQASTGPGDELEGLGAILHEMRIDVPSRKEWVEMTNAFVETIHATAEHYRQGYLILI